MKDIKMNNYLKDSNLKYLEKQLFEIKLANKKRPKRGLLHQINTKKLEAEINRRKSSQLTLDL